MPRKRRTKRGSAHFRAAPLLFLAALIGAVVAFAVYPRHAHRQTSPAVPSKIAARLTAEPSAPFSAAPTVTPPAKATPSPIASASASPAASPAPSPGSARVAIVVDDCGQWIDTERAFLRLPIPLTLAVLPYVRYTKTIADDAAAAGKGVMLHLPMEPISHLYPGPGEITIAMSDAQIAAQTNADVEQVPLAKGFNNHEGSAATADPRVMRDVLNVAKAHDLFFIDSRTTAQTVAAATASAQGVPSASRQVFLDDHASVAYTESMLERAAAIAKRDGSAIAIGHPKSTTLQALTLMYPKMQAQGIQFVFAAQLVR
jgi:polysaccharide deacetylase 2 family uncharacterized protein YibQ